MHTLAGSNMITLINHKHKYVTLEMSISMDSVATRFYSLMFSTVVYCCDDFQGDRFVKCMENGRLWRIRGHLRCRGVEVLISWGQSSLWAYVWAQSQWVDMINERKMRCRQVKAARYIRINFALKTTSAVLTCNRNVDNSQSENASRQ